MIKISGLYKSFGDKHVLRGIDLEIEKGKTTCIIGKSGSGKSVLLKNIVGLLNPDKGDVTVDGENLSELDQFRLFNARKKMGYVFQSAALFDSYNVFENVVLGLIEHGEKDQNKLEDEAKDVLSSVGLLPELHDPNFDKEWEILKVKNPSDLSGGMRKRVGVARALTGSPEYIFYDEPTTGLDPATSEQIDELIVRLAKKYKVTSIVITHDMFSVYRVADKVAFLHEGEMKFQGTEKALRVSEDQKVREFIERFL